MAMIEIREVSKWYGTFQVLAECSSRVDKGEVVVVCGPSGSGKSTLIKCVNGLEPFQRGEILVDGIGVEKSAKIFFRALIHYMRSSTTFPKSPSRSTANLLAAWQSRPCRSTTDVSSAVA